MNGSKSVMISTKFDFYDLHSTLHNTNMKAHHFSITFFHTFYFHCFTEAIVTTLSMSLLKMEPQILHVDLEHVHDKHSNRFHVFNTMPHCRLCFFCCHHDRRFLLCRRHVHSRSVSPVIRTFNCKYVLLPQPSGPQSSH